MSVFFGNRGAEQRGMEWWGQGFDAPPGNRVVTPDTALYLTPVFAAVRHIVDYASTTPVGAYNDQANGAKKEITLPPLFRLQNGPGRAGLGQWIGQAMYGIVTSGNAVGIAAGVDTYGNPTDVKWLHHSRWSYARDQGMWFVDGKPFPEELIVHIPWIVPTGQVLGLSPIEHYKGWVAAGLSAQEYADVKRGGGIPPAILKNTARTLTPEQADVMKRRAVASFAKGDPFVSGNDWDFQAVTIPPNQALFVETLKMSANQVAAVYGLEPREVGGEAGGSSDTLKYVNDESLELNRAANVRPYLKRLEDAFSRLMPANQCFNFRTDARIRTDTKTQFDIWNLELQMGLRSVNEIRALRNLPPIPGGDTYNVGGTQPPAALTPRPTQGPTEGVEQ